MATKAVDIVTIFHALNVLENNFLGKDRVWKTDNDFQWRVFELYTSHKEKLGKLKGLKALASKDWRELNRFLVKNQFDPMFEPFVGIGAASILDMVVEWLKKASTCQIYANQREYPGFEIPKGGHIVYDPSGTDFRWVAALATKSGGALWLALPEKQPEDELALINMAFSAMSGILRPRNDISTVQIPEIDFDIKPDLQKICGAETYDQKGKYWFISQAKQQFKLRMNKEGAHVKVATAIAMERGISFGPHPLIINRPFMGWFTQPGAPSLPLAIFYVDYDCWKKAGDLKDM